LRDRPLFEDSLDSPCGLMTPIPLRKEVLLRVDAVAVLHAHTRDLTGFFRRRDSGERDGLP
jgi:hypothetical protein